MDTTEEWKGRFNDLAQQCGRDQRYTYTGFLGMAEQDVFYRMCQALSCTEYALFGGIPDSERKMVRFGSEASLGYEEAFPIRCVEVAPIRQKFADTLSHRDFLGGLMNLGIERSALGDIIIDENKGYVFCTEVIAPFVLNTLEQVRHTRVACRITEAPRAAIPREERKTLQVSSERIDGVISKLCGLSRSGSIELFRQKKVFLNGRICENSSHLLKEGDNVTVRGYGRFVYDGFEGISKKGKKYIVVRVRK